MEPGPGGRGAARGQRPPSTSQPREQERKLEQEKLSGVVKSVHRRLRKKYREGKQAAGEGRRIPRLGQLFPASQATIDTHGGGTSAQAATERPSSCYRLPEPQWAIATRLGPVPSGVLRPLSPRTHSEERGDGAGWAFR